MKITLNPGEKIEIEFADSDGSINVEFKAFTGTEPGHILVHTEWKDTSGRVGEIYKEVFGLPEESKVAAVWMGEDTCNG